MERRRRAGGEEALKLTGTQEFAHLPVEKLLVGSASVAGLRWCWRKRRLNPAG